LICHYFLLGEPHVGVVSLTDNIDPELCGTIFSAFQQNNLERFAVVRDALESLHKLMFKEPSPGRVKYL